MKGNLIQMQYGYPRAPPKFYKNKLNFCEISDE